MGFDEEVHGIISKIHRQRQTVLFSATMPQKFQVSEREHSVLYIHVIIYYCYSICPYIYYTMPYYILCILYCTYTSYTRTYISLTYHNSDPPSLYRISQKTHLSNLY